MDVFEFSKDVSEMNEGELRATLVDLVAKHNEQVGDVGDYETKIEALEGDLQEYRADAQSARAFFSELVGSQKDMDPEILADKFTAAELQEQVDMEAFSLESESEDGEEGEDGDRSTFDDKPEKSDNLPGDDDLAKYREDARSALARMGVVAYDN